MELDGIDLDGTLVEPPAGIQHMSKIFAKLTTAQKKDLVDYLDFLVKKETPEFKEYRKKEDRFFDFKMSKVKDLGERVQSVSKAAGKILVDALPGRLKSLFYAYEMLVFFRSAFELKSTYFIEGEDVAAETAKKVLSITSRRIKKFEDKKLGK